jgi:hypothetical protein
MLHEWEHCLPGGSPSSVTYCTPRSLQLRNQLLAVQFLYLDVVQASRRQSPALGGYHLSYPGIQRESAERYKLTAVESAFFDHFPSPWTGLLSIVVLTGV